MAISGSLRSASSNTAVLAALDLLGTDGVQVFAYPKMGLLPFFNPDLDRDPLPELVSDLRAEVGRSDAIVISSPEYAHGVPGVLKNLLDWLVGSLEFPGKLVGLINTSPRAEHAPAQLTEILTTMSARLPKQASVTIPLLGSAKDAASLIADEEVALTLRVFVAALMEDVGSRAGHTAVSR